MISVSGAEIKEECNDDYNFSVHDANDFDLSREK